MPAMLVDALAGPSRPWPILRGPVAGGALPASWRGASAWCRLPSMADAELDLVLLRKVVDAQLPPEEPISRWLADADDAGRLRLRAGDHALLLGGCEYHVDRRTGVVEVRDYSDPRSMRSQRYEPGRPQPFMAPSVEDRDLPAA